VSNERYPTSSFKRIVVFDALAMTVDSRVLGQMQVFITISSIVDFILENYVHQSSQVD
jgi:hypothetical protein